MLGVKASRQVDSLFVGAVKFNGCKKNSRQAEVELAAAAAYLVEAIFLLCLFDLLSCQPPEFGCLEFSLARILRKHR